jgi:poly(3-hydroxybutyrate) depolymerase
VFVTGLSAGAAMTACLLASYPDLFAGGAIVAGLPAGAASGVVGAMTRMSGHGAELPAEEWMGRARGLAPIGYTGPWPSVSIWQGDADHVVAPVNATHLAQQWCTLEGPFSPPITETVRPGIIRERWSRLGEAPRIESWRIAGMGHIYPTQANGGIAASTEIAGFWGISRR